MSILWLTSESSCDTCAMRACVNAPFGVALMAQVHLLPCFLATGDKIPLKG